MLTSCISWFDFLKSKPTTHNAKLVRALLDWFATNARDLPWRHRRDPYAIWVSEIMLQQTQVKTVIPYWERWMRELPTIKALARAKTEKIHKLWEGLGYYTRVRNMQKAAQQIVAERGGNFPSDFDGVLALPGIGLYTAGAICSIAYNQPKPILDGNVIRILTRIYGISGDPREKQTNAQLWQLAEELVEQALKQSHTPDSTPRASFFNQSMMELGALICTPRQPQCDLCPARGACIARREDRIDELPNKTKRVAVTERKFIAFIVERDGKFLVRQRPARVVNAHLWEFPNEEITSNVDSTAAAKTLDLILHSRTPLCTVRHSITRYRITLEAWRAAVKSNKPNARQALEGRWLTLAELNALPLASAHRKVLSKLQPMT